MRDILESKGSNGMNFQNKFTTKEADEALSAINNAIGSMVKVFESLGFTAPTCLLLRNTSDGYLLQDILLQSSNYHLSDLVSEGGIHSEWANGVVWHGRNTSGIDVAYPTMRMKDFVDVPPMVNEEAKITALYGMPQLKKSTGS